MDNYGRPAGGGYLKTLSHLNPTQIKLVYQDVDGTIPWPYADVPNGSGTGILIDSNGTQGPFYWQTNTENVNDTYYLELYDSSGNLLWTLDNYFPPTGGGGGGGGTTYQPLNNLIANNVFLDNTGNFISGSLTTNNLLCPSNHKGFTPAQYNPVIPSGAGARGVVGPDIRFVKGNTSAPLIH